MTHQMDAKGDKDMRRVIIVAGLLWGMAWAVGSAGAVRACDYCVDLEMDGVEGSLWGTEPEITPGKFIEMHGGKAQLYLYYGAGNTGKIRLSQPAGQGKIKVWNWVPNPSPGHYEEISLPHTWNLEANPAEYPPMLLYVSPEQPSDSWRDVQLELEWVDYPTGLTYPVDPDYVNITVMDVDVDTDTNNDGVISATDHPNEDGSEMAGPGRVLCLDRAGDGAGLDDLAEVDICVKPSVPDAYVEDIILLATPYDPPGPGIKVWADSSKTTEIVLPKLYSKVSDVPTKVYVDSVATAGTPTLGLACILYQAPIGWDPRPAVFFADDVRFYLVDTIAYSPYGMYVYTWEPANYELNSAPVTAVTSEVADSGYDVELCRFKDTTGENDNLEGCTRAHFDSLGNGAILAVHTHVFETNHHEFLAVTTGTEGVADAWINGDPHLIKYQQENGTWHIWADDVFIQNHWKADLDCRKSIVFFFGCCGADCLLQAAGGQVGFGYVEDIDYTVEQADAHWLLRRMNGKDCSANDRVAKRAYDVGGFSYSFKLVGNGFSTLCPTCTAFGPCGNSVPLARRNGVAIFDTYLDSTANPEDVLPASHDGWFSGKRWFGNASGKFGISFDYDSTWADLSIIGPLCTTKVNDDNSQTLDADRVAPLGGNIDWSFQRAWW